MRRLISRRPTKPDAIRTGQGDKVYGNGIAAWPVAGTSKPLKESGTKKWAREEGHDLPTIVRPQCKPSRFFMKPIRLLSAVAPFVAAICLTFFPAFAADPIFPPGVRVGMTPLVGLSRAKSF